MSGRFMAWLISTESVTPAAPTSAPAYNDLITCFAEGDHYDRIIEVAKDALRVAVN